MAELEAILEDLKKRYGLEGQRITYKVEKCSVEQFAKAIDDPNPLWNALAPPTMVSIIKEDEAFDEIARWDHRLTSSGLGILAVGSEIEHYKSVLPGETVTMTRRLASVKEDQSRRLGKVLISVTETIFRNQKEELLAKCRQVSLTYKIKDR